MRPSSACRENPLPGLVVIDPDPPELLRWVSSETAEVVLTLGSGAGDGPIRPDLPHGLSGRRNVDSHGLNLVRVPFDGPQDALLTVVAALQNRLRRPGCELAVVPETSPGPPPAPELLAQVAGAGAIPGADLEGFDWVATDGVWLTGHAGLAQLHYSVAKPAHSSELAQLICQLDLLGPTSPAAHWADGVASGRTAATSLTWQVVLRAMYVEATVARLCRDR